MAETGLTVPAAIAIAVLACLLVLLAVGIILYCLCKRYRLNNRSQKQKKTPGDTAAKDGHEQPATTPQQEQQQTAGPPEQQQRSLYLSSPNVPTIAEILETPDSEAYAKNQEVMAFEREMTSQNRDLTQSDRVLTIPFTQQRENLLEQHRGMPVGPKKRNVRFNEQVTLQEIQPEPEPEPEAKLVNVITIGPSNAESDTDTDNDLTPAGSVSDFKVVDIPPRNSNNIPIAVVPPSPSSSAFNTVADKQHSTTSDKTQVNIQSMPWWASDENIPEKSKQLEVYHSENNVQVIPQQYNTLPLTGKPEVPALGLIARNNINTWKTIKPSQVHDNSRTVTITSPTSSDVIFMPAAQRGHITLPRSGKFGTLGSQAGSVTSAGTAGMQQHFRFLNEYNTISSRGSAAVLEFGTLNANGTISSHGSFEYLEEPGLDRGIPKYMAKYGSVNRSYAVQAGGGGGGGRVNAGFEDGGDGKGRVRPGTPKLRKSKLAGKIHTVKLKLVDDDEVSVL